MNRPTPASPVDERCLSAPYRGDLQISAGVIPPQGTLLDLFFSLTSFPQTQDRSLLDARDRHRHAPFYRLELAEEPRLPLQPYDHRPAST